MGLFELPLGLSDFWFKGKAELPWGLETIYVNGPPYEMYGERKTQRNFFIKAYWRSGKLLLDSWVIEARQDTNWGGYLGGFEDGFARFSYREINPWFYEFSGTESIDELKVLCEVSSKRQLANRLTLLAQDRKPDLDDEDLWIGDEELHTALLERGFLPSYGDGDLSCWDRWDRGIGGTALYDVEKLRTILECGAPLAQGRISLEAISSILGDE